MSNFHYVSTVLGCDPEFFVARKDGKIVGSEVALKEVFAQDVKYEAALKKGVYNTTHPSAAGLVEDGVQVEINPYPGTCREGLAGHISAAFARLKVELDKTDFTACFNTVIEMDPKELERLSEKAKKLGCAPSLNVYDKKAGITVDGSKTMTRSAGGHIHMSLSPTLKREIPRLVNLLDVLLGNTCVLIDRDPRAAERRKLYGRAGEYRTPKHGVEYRTLSNFWLRAYPLMSFVMAAGRFCISILTTTLAETKVDGKVFNPEEELLDLVNLGDVRTAINTNDLKLARRNWGQVEKFITKHLSSYSSAPFTVTRLPAMNYFFDVIAKKGIEAWFPDDPMHHWATLRIGGNGWESFIDHTVPNKMSAEERPGAKDKV